MQDALAVKTAGSFSALLKRFPDVTSLAADLKLSYFTVTAWIRRDSVPEIHWDAIEAAAKGRGIKGVTYTRFRAIAASRRRSLALLGK